jgi:DNA helicase HerA-like ATPase
MKVIQQNNEPINVIIDKDRQRGLYIAHFDYRQTSPRVSLGSTWVAKDIRHNRRFLMRVVDTAYNTNYDLKQILSHVRDDPNQPFDSRALEYYCSEAVWLCMEGEFVNGSLQEVNDQPTVLQTFLSPTTSSDNLIVASPDIRRGFIIGNLRSGSRELAPTVTLEDRFVGYRTLVSGASGFGKSTLVRNIARRWMENTGYGVIIDDLKGEYIGNTKNEKGEIVYGLANHPNAKQNLYLLTPFPRKYEDSQFINRIAELIPLEFHIDDIPPDSLGEVATHISPAQQQFLDMYHDKEGLFSLLLREDEDSNTITDDWHKHFKGFIVATKSGRANLQTEDYSTDLSDFQQSSYTPIFSVRKHLKRLEQSHFIRIDGKSCLPKIRSLLKRGATIILDKNGLTDSQRMIVSTVIANELYKHNERYSSGSPDEQKQVIHFVYLVEEAHLLLSREKAREGSVFVNFAKTGRSFQIGLVAVTQRPSSVDANILTQFDNFITFRLTNERDVKDLVEAKSDFQGYEGDIRIMGRGAAVTAFGEPTKVQSIQVFDWTRSRATTLLLEEQENLLPSNDEAHKTD